MARIRRHPPILLVGLIVGFSLVGAACGSSAGSTKATSTVASTVAATTTTRAPVATTTTQAPEATTTTDAGGPTTTEGKGPIGDEKLIPILLDIKDFGPNLKPGSSTLPDQSFCEGHPFNTHWQASANTSVDSADQNAFAGAAESILQFAPGDAAKFLAEFPALSAVCATAKDGIGVVLKPISGFGDAALRGTSSATGDQSFPIDAVVVKVGDDVLVLFSLNENNKSLLTDALIKKAIAKVKAG